MSKRIVILGGGVGGAEVIRRVHKHVHGRDNVSITIVDKHNYSTFTPMLHEVATGSVQPRDITHPIRQIISCCLEHFHEASVQSIDLAQKIVKTDKSDISYDYLVVALGSTSRFFGIPGAQENALVLKTMNDAVRLRRHLIDTFEEVSRLSLDDPHRRDKLHFLLVGAGYTGVETAGQISDLVQNEFKELYPEIRPGEAKVTIVQGNERILPILSENGSKRAAKRLEELGVNIITGTRVTSVTVEGVATNTGRAIPTHNVIWTSGVKAVGADFFDESLIEKGRVKAKATLQVIDHPNVFVVGDIAGVVESDGPHPQTAQAAVQQARVAADNVVNLIDGNPVQAFHYNHKGDLVPIGDRWAVAEVKTFKFTGFFAWWLRRTVYLQGIFSFADKIRVVFNWTMNLFTKRDTTRL